MYRIETADTNTLPKFWDIVSLADVLGIRVLDLERIVDEQHYKTFYINKDTGKYCKYSSGLRLRRIDAPCEELKAVQNVIKDLLLELPYSDANYGFISGKTVRDAAESVAKGDVIVHCDIKDFFPSHTATILVKRLQELFAAKWPGVFSKDTIRFLVKALTYGGRLTQGSPASPIVTIVLNKDMDERLQSIASQLGFTYVRYADDLCFSGTVSNQVCIELIDKLHDAVHPYRLNGKKTGIMRTSSKPFCRGFSITSKGFMQSAMIAKIAQNVRSLFPQAKIAPSPKNIQADFKYEGEVKDFIAILDNLERTLNVKYPSFVFKVRRKFFYIQSYKTVLGLHVDDGHVNIPRRKYEDLRLESMIVGIQRALFYLKKLSRMVGLPNVEYEAIKYATKSTLKKTPHNTFRNLMKNPINRKEFNGRRAWLRVADPAKYTKLLEVEDKYFKKVLKEIRDSVAMSMLSMAAVCSYTDRQVQRTQADALARLDASLVRYIKEV